MKIHKPITKQSFKVNKPVNVLCETYRIREQVNEATGKIEAVFLEGVAITFGKPTRNRVAYTYESGIGAHKTLVGKPFLDTHNDTSIRTHPPFGHVEMTEPGTNPANGMLCLNYRVNIDPEEKVFIRKAKRGDIPGVSIQVLVDNVRDREDGYGGYIEATIREYLELSAVLIPGDGDTSMALAESFKNLKEKKYQVHSTISDESGTLGEVNYSMEVDTSNGEGIISPDGVVPKKKVLDKQSYLFEGERKTEVAFKGCNCPACGMQMLKDNYSNGFRLRCWACNYKIAKIRR